MIGLKAYSFLSIIALAMAESHRVTFVNNCGHGTPMLIQGQNVLSKGGDFTSNGPLISAISYLQTGQCGFNGEKCTLVELTLRNPPSPGAGSAADVSLISPHAFNVAAGFNYINGCSSGFDCTSASCSGAFTNPTNGKIVSCEANNAGLEIRFCN